MREEEENKREMIVNESSIWELQLMEKIKKKLKRENVQHIKEMEIIYKIM